jgi:HAD superfamily hydrolase (TIGR01549 family)
MSSPKYIFFDVGNIFLTYDRVFDKVCFDFNIKKSDFEAVYDLYDRDANMGKIDISDVWKVLTDKLHLRDAVNYDFVNNWISDYDRIDPIFDLVSSLSGKIDMGIISNYYRGFFEATTAQGFIPKVKFDPIIISAEVHLRKPDPEIFILAQSKIKYQGDEVIFVDDKIENLESASRTLGWQTFLFDYQSPDLSVGKLKEILNFR